MLLHVATDVLVEFYLQLLITHLLGALLSLIEVPTLDVAVNSLLILTDLFIQATSRIKLLDILESFAHCLHDLRCSFLIECGGELHGMIPSLIHEISVLRILRLDIEVHINGFEVLS